MTLRSEIRGIDHARAVRTILGVIQDDDEMVLEAFAEARADGNGHQLIIALADLNCRLMTPGDAASNAHAVQVLQETLIEYTSRLE